MNVLKTGDFDKMQIDDTMAEWIAETESVVKLKKEVRFYLQKRGYLMSSKSVTVENSEIFLYKKYLLLL